MVKVIDIKEMIKVVVGDKAELPEIHKEECGIIVGRENIVVFNDEAVHTLHARNSSMQFSLGYLNPKVFIVPVKREGCDATGYGVTVRQSVDIEIPVELILRTCETMGYWKEPGEWVRRFGSRIENNYSLLLQTIKEIGLNPKDYPRGKIENGVWNEKENR